MLTPLWKCLPRLLLKRNWDSLKNWIREILNEIKIPVIFKIGAYDTPDVPGAIEVMRNEGISIIHINIINSEENSKGLRFLKNLNKDNIFVIAGGSINNINGAKRVLSTGANAISIGSAAIKNPNICGNIQKLLLNI